MIILDAMDEMSRSHYAAYTEALSTFASEARGARRPSFLAGSPTSRLDSDIVASFSCPSTGIKP